MGYRYYDTPEGVDGIKKLWFTTKYAGIAGLVAGVWDVTYYSHPKGYVPTIARFAYFTVPFVGMAGAFTSTTYLLTKFRQKDDKLNYFMGGLAAGSVFGIWRKNAWFGLFTGCAFGIMAVVKKQSVEEGWELFPENKLIQYSTVTSHRDWDFTMAENSQGNWRRE